MKLDKRKGDDIEDNMKGKCQKERCIEVRQDRFQWVLQALQQIVKTVLSRFLL